MTQPVPEPESPCRVIVMGVSGAGKSAVGRSVATRLVLPFFDADDYHPPANITKMAAGIPLTDDDRWPWLDALNALLRKQPRCVLACSALRQAYRDRLAGKLPGIRVVYLHADFDALADRMQRRADHFMPPALLRSQFDTLEPPTDAITIDVSRGLDAVVDETIARLSARG